MKANHPKISVKIVKMSESSNAIIAKVIRCTQLGFILKPKHQKTQKDYIGRELAGRIASLQNKNVLIVSTAFRLIIVALIAMTNCQPRHTPVYFHQDWIYIGRTFKLLTRVHR